MEEIKPQTPDLGKTETPNLGQTGNPKIGPDNEKIKPEIPPTDFKVAEIWIRSGNVMLDATEAFWQDRCRALGLLELCKDIVKTAKAPEKPKIIIPGNGGLRHKIINFARNFRRGK